MKCYLEQCSLGTQGRHDTTVYKDKFKIEQTMKEASASKRNI